jgi:hypothetical protein
MKKERKAELFINFVSELSTFYNVENDVYTLEELIADNSFTEDSGLVHEIDLPRNIVVSLDLTYNKKYITVTLRNHTDSIRFRISETMEINKLSVESFLKVVEIGLNTMSIRNIEKYIHKNDFYESAGRILQGDGE